MGNERVPCSCVENGVAFQLENLGDMETPEYILSNRHRGCRGTLQLLSEQTNVLDIFGGAGYSTAVALYGGAKYVLYLDDRPKAHSLLQNITQGITHTATLDAPSDCENVETYLLDAESRSFHAVCVNIPMAFWNAKVGSRLKLEKKDGEDKSPVEQEEKKGTPDRTSTQTNLKERLVRIMANAIRCATTDGYMVISHPQTPLRLEASKKSSISQSVTIGSLVHQASIREQRSLSLLKTLSSGPDFPQTDFLESPGLQPYCQVGLVYRVH